MYGSFRNNNGNVYFKTYKIFLCHCNLMLETLTLLIFEGGSRNASNASIVADEYSIMF